VTDEAVSANASPCANCGHVWFPGQRPHVFVDERNEIVEDGDGALVLCNLCRHQRAMRHPAS